MGETENLSAAIVEAVSAKTGTRISELSVLCDVVDPDALDTLFAGPQATGRVEFSYSGYRVTVNADRTIDIPDAN